MPLSSRSTVPVMSMPMSSVMPSVAPSFALISDFVNLFSLSAPSCASERRVNFGLKFVPAAAASSLDSCRTYSVVNMSVDFLLDRALAVLSRSSAMPGPLTLWL